MGTQEHMRNMVCGKSCRQTYLDSNATFATYFSDPQFPRLQNTHRVTLQMNGNSTENMH